MLDPNDVKRIAITYIHITPRIQKLLDVYSIVPNDFIKSCYWHLVAKTTDPITQDIRYIFESTLYIAQASNPFIIYVVENKYGLITSVDFSFEELI